MASSDQNATVTIEVARVEALGRVATSAGHAVAALSFAGLSPTTVSGDTLGALARCAAPATTTAHAVGTRFGACGLAIAVAATTLRGADTLKLRVA